VKEAISSFIALAGCWCKGLSPLIWDADYPKFALAIEEKILEI